jgi:hypothetical protein
MTGTLARAQMIGRPHAIAYWLLPEKAAREIFTNEIRKLARRFRAPAFEAHVTVFVGPENSHDPVETLHELGAVTIELTISSIRFSGQFTKTLFVQFEPSVPLQELGDRIWKASGAPEPYVIDPHLSLLYARLSWQTKQELADQTSIPLRVVRFTSMCAMRCACPTTIQKDVEQWRLLAPLEKRSSVAPAMD